VALPSAGTTTFLPLLDLLDLSPSSNSMGEAVSAIAGFRVLAEVWMFWAKMRMLK